MDAVSKEWGTKQPEERELEPELVSNPVFQAEQICQFKVETDGNIKYQLDYVPGKDRKSFLFWDMTVPYESVWSVDTEVMYQLYKTIAGKQEKRQIKKQFY